MFEVRRYLTHSGGDVAISAGVDRLSLSNFGDDKALRHGVSELRIDWGPGYRVYYAMVGQKCVLRCAEATRVGSRPT